MAETLEDLRAEITRLQTQIDKLAGPSTRTTTLTHGLQIIQGPDIAAIAIPAVSANNEPLLDGAAGHFQVLGSPEATFITQGVSYNRATGQWNAEPGVTQARCIVLDTGRIDFWYWTGPAGAQNITWVGQGDMDANGALNVPALLVNGQPLGVVSATQPGYLRIGAITLLWGVNDITTGGAGQTTLFIPYPIAVTGTLAVVATLQTTDDSVVWLATDTYGPTGFVADVYRNASTGFLAVYFTWLAVAIT